MDKIVITAASLVSESDVRANRLGTRFGRMDLTSQLAVLAVEALDIDFEARPRDRTGICLGAWAGSLATDLEFWRGRDAAGGPSPTLFAYTLPSAAIGELAIRHRLTGVNLCFVGGDIVLPEAGDLLRRGEVEACLCVWCRVVTPALAEIIQAPAAAQACAVFLQRDSGGLHGAHLDTAPGRMEQTPHPNPLPTAWGEGIRNLRGGSVEMRPWRELQENDRDMESLCAVFCAQNSAR